MRRLVTRLALLALAGALTACAGGGASSTRELPTLSDMTAAQKRSSIRLQLAVGYYQDRKYDVALDEIKQALVADPNNADAYGVRALVYTAMKLPELAEENYQHAMRLAPNNPDLANNYGSFLCNNGKEKEAIKYFESALANRSYSTPVSALVNAGTCSMRMKNYTAAEGYLMDALRLAPDLPITSVELARVYVAKHDYTRAGFFVSRLLSVTKPENLDAETLWLGARVVHKNGDKATETSLVTQLAKQYPNSNEYAAYKRGAFDE